MVAYNINAGSDTLYTCVTELTFKRYAIPSHTGTAFGRFFYCWWCRILDIYVYSDESGVFDKKHNDIFVFGGVMFLCKDDRDICARKYSSVERMIRRNEHLGKSKEVKATTIRNKDKGKLYRSLNSIHKFGVIIYEQRNLDRIFTSKKDKQRYLDYAYKIAIKRQFKQLITSKAIVANDVNNLYFYVDEHTTATNGCYELREGLEQEFKLGTYNEAWDHFFPPIFSNLQGVYLQFCDSSATRLVRVADIVANHIYHAALQDKLPHGKVYNSNNLYVSTLP